MDLLSGWLLALAGIDSPGLGLSLGLCLLTISGFVSGSMSSAPFYRQP